MKIKHGCTRHTSCKECSTCSVLCCTKIENLTVKIGNEEILKDINIHIHCGELTALIGPNGGGKSTFLKAIIGEVRHRGSLKFVKSNGNDEIRPTIGYVPQTTIFEKDSPISVLDLFVASIYKYPVWLPILPKIRQKVQEALIVVEAQYLIDRRLGALSGGELQRVLLALALSPLPEVLLLDEPVSGIDSNGIDMFYRIVNDVRNKYDLSIILVSHELDIIRTYADRVVLLNKRILINGSPDEVYKSDVFKKTFKSRED